MSLKELAKRVKIRRISRAVYFLIPKEMVDMLDIKEGDKAVILYNRGQHIIAYRLKKAKKKRRNL